MMKYNLVPYPKTIETREGSNRHTLYVEGDIAANAGGLFPHAGDLAITFQKTDRAPHPDAYELIIEPDAVLIRGEDEKCRFYGLVTLYQLVLQFGTNLPLLRIADYAVTPHRAVQLCYGQMLVDYKPDFAENFVREMALLKATHIYLYLEMDYAYEALPQSKRKGQITPQDVQKLKALAKKYFIRIVPAVNILGHSGDFLAHQINDKYKESDPKDGKLISSSALCPLSEAWREKAKQILTQLIADFDSEMIHVGGDEVKQMGVCRICHPQAEELGKIGVYLNYFIFVNDFLKAHGKKMGLWSDQVLILCDGSRFWEWRQDEIDRTKFDGYYRQLELLKDNTVFYDWWYSGESSATQNFFESHGFRYIATASTSGNGTLCTAISHTLFQHALYRTALRSKSCLGTLTADWYNVMTNHAQQQYFNFAGGLALSWCGCDDTFLDGQSKREFERAYSAIHYGVRDDSLLDYMHYSGDFSSDLLCLFDENFRGVLLRKNIFGTDNPLHLIIYYSKYFEDGKLEAYRQKVEKLQKLWDKISWKNEDYSLRLPLIVHRHILSRMQRFFAAYEEYAAAAEIQYSDKRAFRRHLTKAAHILGQSVQDYPEAIRYARYCTDVLGLDNASFLRVKDNCKNIRKLRAFLLSLRNGKRPLPTIDNICRLLFHPFPSLFAEPNQREWANEPRRFRSYDVDNHQYDLFSKFASEIDFKCYY